MELHYQLTKKDLQSFNKYVKSQITTKMISQTMLSCYVLVPITLSLVFLCLSNLLGLDDTSACITFIVLGLINFFTNLYIQPSHSYLDKNDNILKYRVFSITPEGVTESAKTWS